MTVNQPGRIAPLFSETEKKRGAKLILRGARSLALAAIGFLFAGTAAPLDTYPFAIALTSSLTADPVFAVIGIILRMIFSADLRSAVFPYGAVAVVICAARYVFTFLFGDKKTLLLSGRITDALTTRVTYSVAGSLLTAIILLLFYGFDGYILAGAAFSLCCSGALTFLLTAFFDSRYAVRPARDAGCVAVMFLTALSLSGSTVFSVSPALIFSFAAAMVCGYYAGSACGCAVGFLLGIACGYENCIGLALFGLCSGLFIQVNAVAAASASLIAVICSSMAVGGTEKIFALLPEALIGGAIVTIPAALGLLPQQSGEPDQAAVLCRELAEKKRREESKMKLELLSRSMESLSQIIGNLSERLRKPDEFSLEKLCREVIDENCAACGRECKFRRKDRDDDALARIVAKLISLGKISADEIYDISGAKCPNREKMIAEINARVGELTKYTLKYDKTRIFVLDYDAMAKLLADASLAGGADYPVDKVLSERLKKALLRAGMTAENVVVCGTRKKYIAVTGRSVMTASLGTEDILSLCERVCRTRFCRPEFMFENNCGAMTLEGRAVYSVSYAGKQSEKQGERVCGDTVSIVESRDGYFYCFICDGMGSGPQAALASKICRVFLEKMLACGGDKSNTLQMINTFLKNKGTECFSTVDLLEVDLHAGKASFLKSGAAPSYIRRGNDLFRISSGTLPVGILPDVAAEMTAFDLKNDDVIIMVSDGISGDFEVESGSDPSWFADFLAKEWTWDLDIMAEKILLAAQKAGRRSDDMTVELLRVGESKYALPCEEEVCVSEA